MSDLSLAVKQTERLAKASLRSLAANHHYIRSLK